MSEKIYACLLRLLPPSFRRRYQEEALQLLRDRFRDERGFYHRLRLILDLITDIVGALPQAYRNSYAEVAAAASLTPQFDGVPSFRILQKEPLRRGAIATAGILSVTALATFAFVMGHPIPYHPATQNGPISPIESVIERLNQPLSPNSAENRRSDAPEPSSGNASRSEAPVLARANAGLSFGAKSERLNQPISPDSAGNKYPASPEPASANSIRQEAPASPRANAGLSFGAKSAASAASQPNQWSEPKASARYSDQGPSVAVARPSSSAQSQSESIRTVAGHATSSNMQALSPASVAVNLSERWIGSFRIVGGDTDVPRSFILKRDGETLTGTGGPNSTEQFPISHGVVAGGFVTFELNDGTRRFLYDLRFEDKDLRGTLSIRSAGGMRFTKVRLERIQ
jgi:hypothetical protein